MEKKILLQCAHANVVHLITAFSTSSKYFIVMEMCHNGSLRDYYTLHGPFSSAQIAYVIREALEGLAHIHRQNIVHRDIKAANILLTDSFGVRISDFGIMAEVSTTSPERSTVIGSYYWMVST
jgi:serine/threonine protein kinase